MPARGTTVRRAAGKRAAPVADLRPRVRPAARATTHDGTEQVKLEPERGLVADG